MDAQKSLPGENEQTRAQMPCTADLSGKVAVITGAASGIGRAVCERFVAEGCAIAAVDVNIDGLEELTRWVRIADGHGSITPLGCDVAAEDQVTKLAAEVDAMWGRVDFLVAAAGILRVHDSLPKPVVEMSLAEWDRVLAVNLRGIFLTNRAFVGSMIARRGGDILNIGSTAGLHGRAHDSAYCASKFGVIGLSESLAAEVRQYGVRVQVLSPDAVATPIWEQNGPFRPESALQPERVADLIHYLVTLPRDTVIVGPVVAPFQSRRRSRGGRRSE